MICISQENRNCICLRIGTEMVLKSTKLLYNLFRELKMWTLRKLTGKKTHDIFNGEKPAKDGPLGK